MKRLVCLALTLLTVLPLAFGCAGGRSPAATDPETEPAEVPTDPATAAATDPETEPETEPETDPLPPPPDVEVVKDGKCALTVVYPKDDRVITVNTKRLLSTALTEKLGADFGTVTTDEVKEDVIKGEYISDAPEWLIGETNRRESRAVHLTLAQGEYAIRTVGNKLVIIGYNDDLTREAVKAFIADCLEPSDGRSLVLPGDYAVVKAPYAVPEERPTVAFESVTPVGDPIRAEAEQWVMCEIELASAGEYEAPVYHVQTDAVFRHKESGETLCIPAFWDGGTTWRVRFAPTQVGEWEFYTVCTDTKNAGLHHRAGTVTCTAYTGDLAVYRHGFIKTEPGKNYFTHADGTPFFYLGDTHWTLPLEELDSYGSVETQKQAGITQEIADRYGIRSQFTYIMDYRAGQGYTVIQSQPLGWWTNPGQNGWFADTEQNIFTYGVNDIMLEKFQQYDRYFAYIAKLGLVHANAQFGYPTALMTEYFAGKITDDELEALCRYWVARYGAYPVMWTTTQEGDNDYYGERGDCAATPTTNPWRLVMTFVHKYDAYGHPTTCHQEHWSYTRVDNSAFNKLDGHGWYAAQYNTPAKEHLPWSYFREYWNNPGSRPVVNYEGRYDHFWTGTFGARAQGWLAYMNGQVGYGYGVQPIWSIFWSGNGITNWTGSDESGSFPMNDNWVDGLHADAGRQVTYIQAFLSEIEWWRLAPCFDDSYYYEPGRLVSAVSHIENKVYVGYFYGQQKNGSNGRFTGMEPGTYEVTWFNCRTGEWAETETVTVTDGVYKIPTKPDTGDWAMLVRPAE